jgi:iron complex outermembrane receptor protein
MKGAGTVMVILALALRLQAMPSGTVAGKVSDGETQQPLAGANVTIAVMAIGAITDEKGEFLLKGIPPGEYDVRISYVGYVTVTRKVSVSEGGVSSLVVALTSVPIFSQPVTVTATRGRERETPVTFSTLEQQDLRERYTTQDIPVLLSELPSSTSYSESGNGIGYTYLTIRGFDPRRVAVMINGIPQNDPEDHNVYWLDAPDLAASLEDIQVQRGAGSAFYGPPAIGGSVNLVTSAFAHERSVQLSAGIGSFNTRKYSASFTSGLLGDHMAFHGRISKILSGGYRDKSWVDFTSYFLGIVRYDDRMTTQLNIYGGPIADGLAYYGIPKEEVKDLSRRRANPILRPEERESFSQPHVELFHEWRLGPGLTLNNTLFSVVGDGYFDYDGSWAPLSYFRITPQEGFPVNGDPDTLSVPGALIRAQVTNRQWGWLPRFTWKYGRGELLVGAELRIHRSLHWGRLQWAESLPVSVPADHHYYEYRGAKDIFSLYVHQITELTSGMTLMGDLQYAYNRYRLYDEKFVGTDFAVPYHFLNPRIGLNYNLSDQGNVYLSAAYTSREPRLKNLYDAAEASTPASWGSVTPQFSLLPGGAYDFSKPLVKPESLFDLELGGGLGAGGSRVSLNFYWMEFTDEIVKSGQVDRFGQPVTGNANRTRHLGVELSARVRNESGWEFSANATAGRNRFVHHTDYSSGVPAVLDGNPIAGFPDFLANTRVSYRLPHFAVSLAGRFVGLQYTDNFKNAANTVDPFFVSDASVSYQLDSLPGGVRAEAKLQVNNVFDALYAAYGEGAQFFVGAERNIFLNLSFQL